MFHHEKKLCYLVTPKSGSTTLRSLLPGLGFTKAVGKYEHADYSYVIKKYPRVKDYTFFTCVREPISHTKSLYNWAVNVWHSSMHLYDTETTDIKCQGKIFHNFDEFIKILKENWGRCIICPLLWSKNCQTLLRLENLEEDLKRFLKKHDIRTNFQLGFQNKTTKKNSGVDFNDKTFVEIKNLFFNTDERYKEMYK